MIEDLRKKARELLESGDVKVVIGYGEGSLPDKTTPVFITKPDDVDKLVWNRNCLNNLVVYLTKEDIKKIGKPAVVVKGCDAKAAANLIQEKQIARDDVVLLGVRCTGVGQPAFDKCAVCDVTTPKIADEVFGEEIPVNEGEDPRAAEIEKLEKMTPAERWEFWQEELSRCIKCYACRNACPMCYCTRCIVEKSEPQWVESSPHPKGNLSWNVTRAFHLASRCIGCGECERACPMDIPLMLVNKKLAMLVKEAFDYEAGYDPEAELPMASFKLDDQEEFIK